MDALGQAIYNARKSQGWTQQELIDWISEEIGRETPYTQTVLSRYERRDTRIPEDVLKALVKWGIGIGITEARKLNSVRERAKDPRERLSNVEYQMGQLSSKLSQIDEVLERLVSAVEKQPS